MGQRANYYRAAMRPQGVGGGLVQGIKHLLDAYFQKSDNDANRDAADDERAWKERMSDAPTANMLNRVRLYQALFPGSKGPDRKDYTGPDGVMDKTGYEAAMRDAGFNNEWQQRGAAAFARGEMEDPMSPSEWRKLQNGDMPTGTPAPVSGAINNVVNDITAGAPDTWQAAMARMLGASDGGTPTKNPSGPLPAKPQDDAQNWQAELAQMAQDMGGNRGPDGSSIGRPPVAVTAQTPAAPQRPANGQLPGKLGMASEISDAHNATMSWQAELASLARNANQQPMPAGSSTLGVSQQNTHAPDFADMMNGAASIVGMQRIARSPQRVAENLGRNYRTATPELKAEYDRLGPLLARAKQGDEHAAAMLQQEMSGPNGAIVQQLIADFNKRG